jgi:hypothetical protein
MEASMSKRFESAKQSRMRFINHRNGPRTPQEAGAAAVREAERILGETEPQGQLYEGNGHARLPYLSGPGGYAVRCALAASLSAVLPVLDRYAEDSAGSAGWSYSWVMMSRRNRATLDAMSGAQ